MLPSHRRLNSDNDKHNTRSCGHSRTSGHCRLSLCSSHAHKEHPLYPPRRTRHTQGFTGDRGRMSTLAPTLSSHFLLYHLPQTSAPARSQGILHHASCLVLISRSAVYFPSPYTLRRPLASGRGPAGVTESSGSVEKLESCNGCQENPTRVYIHGIDATLFSLHGGEELGAWLGRSRVRGYSRPLGEG